MISIYCGDDTVSSHRLFVEKRHQLRAGSELLEINELTLPGVISGTLGVNLYNTSVSFFGQNLLSLKKNRDLLNQISDGVSLTLWEEKLLSRDIKRYFPKAQIIDSKLPINLFTFLDNVMPGKKFAVLNSASALSGRVDDSILIFMLQRRVKQLYSLMVSDGRGLKLASWQLSRLKSQATSWRKEQLLSFYDKLFTIEKNSKTNQGYYSIAQSLNILFCFYL